MAKKNQPEQESETRKPQSKPKIPFGLQIALILLCGLLASAVVYVLIQNHNKAVREANKPRYTVTFAYQDGTVIDTRQVKEGTGTYPPKLKTDAVFRGWSSGINDVMGDLEVHPMLYEIKDDENFFYFDSVYVQEGQKFTIELQLGGSVYISSAELQLEYDPDVMDFISSADEASCVVTKAEDGTLDIRLNSDTPLREDCRLSIITFLAKPKDVNFTQVNLICKSGTLSVDGKETPATVTTINNNIYYLQEVSQ